MYNNKDSFPPHSLTVHSGKLQQGTTTMATTTVQGGRATRCDEHPSHTSSSGRRSASPPPAPSQAFPPAACPAARPAIGPSPPRLPRRTGSGGHLPSLLLSLSLSPLQRRSFELKVQLSNQQTRLPIEELRPLACGKGKLEVSPPPHRHTHTRTNTGEGPGGQEGGAQGILNLLWEGLPYCCEGSSLLVMRFFHLFRR